MPLSDNQKEQLSTNDSEYSEHKDKIDIKNAKNYIDKIKIIIHNMKVVDNYPDTPKRVDSVKKAILEMTAQEFFIGLQLASGLDLIRVQPNFVLDLMNTIFDDVFKGKKTTQSEENFMREARAFAKPKEEIQLLNDDATINSTGPRKY